MNTKMKKCLLVVVMVFGMIVSFGGNKGEASEKVDINSATIEELQKLDGVGAPLAQKIIDARPYKTVDELQAKVSGIGAAKMKAIIDQGLAVAESFPEKIDINKASLYDLQFLTGVGAPLAQKIIDARPYKTVDELQAKVSGIGAVKLKAIKDQGLAVVESIPEIEEKMIKEWFPDSNLASGVAESMGKNVETVVSRDDLMSITKLGVGSAYSLEGIQILINLTELEVSEGRIRDTSHLSNLKNLKILKLWHCGLENLDDLKGLENLEEIYVPYNNLTNLNGLVNNKNLTYIYAPDNKLTDINVLRNFDKLYDLSVNQNEIHSLEPIANLQKLTFIQFQKNHVSSIEYLNNLDSIFYIIGIGQTIEVPEQILPFGENLVVENKIKNLDGSLIEAVGLDYGGTYNEPNVMWNNLLTEGTKSYKFDLNYRSAEEIKAENFSGTITIPYKLVR